MRSGCCLRRCRRHRRPSSRAPLLPDPPPRTPPRLLQPRLLFYVMACSLSDDPEKALSFAQRALRIFDENEGGAMPPHWCDNCAKNVGTDNQEGKLCCKLCGRVVAEDNFAEEVQFVKSSDGQVRMAGNFVRSAQAHSESRERTRNEAYYGIEGLMYALGIDGGESIANKGYKASETQLNEDEDNSGSEDEDNSVENKNSANQVVRSLAVQPRMNRHRLNSHQTWDVFLECSRNLEDKVVSTAWELMGVDIIGEIIISSII